VEVVCANETCEGSDCEDRNGDYHQAHPPIAAANWVFVVAVGRGCFLVGVEAKPLDGLDDLIDVGIDFDLPLLFLRLVWRVHDFSFRFHQELAAKQKPPDHQVGGCFPEEIFVQ
jgi:hypothetical protein